MKILVTGGAGFIGSHVAEHFADQGHEVHIADRFSYAGKIRNAPAYLEKMRLWVGDLRSDEFCNKLARQSFEFVVHAAASTHVDRSLLDPVQFVRDNIEGTANLLQSMAEASTASFKYQPLRILVYSTDEVYGSTPNGVRFDEQTQLHPSNPYSATKMATEAMAEAYWVTWGLPIMIVRPSNTYGRRQHPEKAVPKFVRQAVAGGPLTVHEDGNGARDWLHVKDHAAGVQAILEAGKAGQAYNLGAGDEHSNFEVAAKIVEYARADAKIEFVPGRPGHDRRYWMECRKVRSLGWEPKISFDEGLKDAVEWNMKNADWWEHDYIKLREASAE